MDTISGEPWKPGRGSRLGPFRHRPFAVYWSGGLLSNLGTWLQAVAGSVYVYQLTGSVFMVGVLNFAAYLPALLFSVHGGIIADRFDRRRVVTIAALASLAIAAALALLALAGGASEWYVIAVAFGLNASWALSKPSFVALLPALVPREEVAEAVGMNSLQFIIGQIAGPLLAALILTVSTAGVAFAINAVTFVGPVMAMAYVMRAGIGADATSAASRREAAATAGASAIDYVRRHRAVAGILVGVIACSAPVELVRTLAPAIVSEGLGQPESAAGILVAALSVGSAVTLLMFVPLRRRRLTRLSATVGVLIQAIGLLITALAGDLAVASLGVWLVGAGFSFTFNELTGSLQERIPDALRGRIMSYHQIAFIGVRPFVAIAVGTLAAIATAQAASLAGIVLAPAGLLGIRSAWRWLGGAPRNRRPATGPPEAPASDAEPIAPPAAVDPD